MAIGTSGNQFKNGGPVSHLMAELIQACETGHEDDSRQLKVHARFAGDELDLRFYSRLRDVNPSSSF
jgi:sarcosine oxidase, subunit beta